MPIRKGVEKKNVITLHFFHLLFIFKNILFINERYRERERKSSRDTGIGGEAGSTQGARRGTQTWVSRITSSAEGGTKPLSHLGFPES